jgi:hypothetical protein
VLCCDGVGSAVLVTGWEVLGEAIPPPPPPTPSNPHSSPRPILPQKNFWSSEEVAELMALTDLEGPGNWAIMLAKSEEMKAKGRTQVILGGWVGGWVGLVSTCLSFLVSKGTGCAWRTGGGGGGDGAHSAGWRVSTAVRARASLPTHPSTHTRPFRWTSRTNGATWSTPGTQLQ